MNASRDHEADKSVPYAKEHDGYRCPNGKVLHLEARRHKIGNNISRRYEAKEADGGVCLLRAPCLQNAETRRNIWPSMVGPPRRRCHSR